MSCWRRIVYLCIKIGCILQDGGNLTSVPSLQAERLLYRGGQCSESIKKQAMKTDIATFRDEVYSVVEAIPMGKVVTYGDIALLVGRPHHARLVGRIMGEAPAIRRLPCHRVVNSRGCTVPNWHEQRGMLEAEGVSFKIDGCVDMRACRWNFMAEG